MDLLLLFTHMLQGYFTGTVAMKSYEWPHTTDYRYIAGIYNTIIHKKNNRYNDTTSVRLYIHEQHPISRPGPWFNIKMLSYQYRKSNCGDKTVVRPSYLHNGISCNGKMTSLYWIRALVVPHTPGQWGYSFNRIWSHIKFYKKNLILQKDGNT